MSTPDSGSATALPSESVPQSSPESSPVEPVAPVRITVVWGNLIEVAADLHVVGHYRGGTPMGVECDFDRAISPPGSRGIITRHVRRRWLAGALGQVSYFPRPVTGDTVKVPAVVGMGRVGTLDKNNARSLFRSLLREVLELGTVSTVATVLIGCGANNLSISDATWGLVHGLADGLRAAPAGTGAVVPHILVVERDRLLAEVALDALRRAAKDEPSLTVDTDIDIERGGQVGAAAATVFAIRALLEKLSAESSASVSDGTRGAILDAIPDELREQVSTRLTAVARQPVDVVNVTLKGLDDRPRGDEEERPPVRVTVRGSADGFLWSAITGTSTIPEREVELDPTLLEQLVRRITPPSPDDEQRFSHLLSHYVVPLDLQRLLDGSAPLIIEVDLRTSMVPWELLLPFSESGPLDEDSEPLAIRQSLARQMRTAYARTDREGYPKEGMRALVIGNPGDPDRNQSVESAAEEAIAVDTILRNHGITVDLLVGAPGSTPPRGASPATRLDVLAAMLTNTYDIVHYIGHGSFVEQQPELSGWVFADDLLRARDLTQLERAPLLVVANACWSAAHPVASSDDQPALDVSHKVAPVLADEFLRAGAGHFIGTSWRLPTTCARTFSTSFYEAALGNADNPPVSVGAAILLGRRALWRGRRDAQSTPEIRAAWAAYQHYGDPTDRLVHDSAAWPGPNIGLIGGT